MDKLKWTSDAVKRNLSGIHELVTAFFRNTICGKFRAIGFKRHFLKSLNHLSLFPMATHSCYSPGEFHLLQAYQPCFLQIS